MTVALEQPDTSALSTDELLRLAVRVLEPDDWQVLRDIRCRALNDSPDAFVADSETVASYRSTEWRREIESSTWVVAWRVGRSGEQWPIGVARSLWDAEFPDARYVEAVWVAGAFRRRGVLKKMLERLEEHARTREATKMMLWVLETNMSAWVAYERLGYEDGKKKADSKKQTATGRFIPEKRMVKNLC